MDSTSKKFESLCIGEENGYLPLPKSFMTNSIHAGQNPEHWSSFAAVPPITLSTTFKQKTPGVFEYEYSRTGNPSRKILETSLAKLENAKYAMTYATGLAAVHNLMTLLKPGDHLISGDNIYGGTYQLLVKIVSESGVTMSFVDTTKPELVKAAILPNTKMLWLETPTNPTMAINDLATLSKICKERNVLVTVDNSFLTPYFQRPLELGADVTMYSVSKYLNGHSDVVMGALVTNNDQIYEKLKLVQKYAGGVPSPFDCYLVSRSFKTLALRMKQHNLNAYAVAKFLQTHPKVTKVLHPGLPDHPQYELFKRQCSGHSGMISFYHTKGLEESKKLLASLKIFTPAGSLGGAISLVALPTIMTHWQVPKPELERLKITDNLIRLSIGTEDTEDLIEDLKQALDLI